MHSRVSEELRMSARKAEEKKFNLRVSGKEVYEKFAIRKRHARGESQGDRSWGDRSQGDRSQIDKTQTDRSRGESDESQIDKTQTDRSRGESDESQIDKTQTDRSRGESDESQVDKTKTDQSQGDKTQTDNGQGNNYGCQGNSDDGVANTNSLRPGCMENEDHDDGNVLNVISRFSMDGFVSSTVQGGGAEADVVVELINLEDSGEESEYDWRDSDRLLGAENDEVTVGAERVLGAENHEVTVGAERLLGAENDEVDADASSSLTSSVSQETILPHNIIANDNNLNSVVSAPPCASGTPGIQKSQLENVERSDDVGSDSEATAVEPEPIKLQPAITKPEPAIEPEPPINSPSDCESKLSCRSDCESKATDCEFKPELRPAESPGAEPPVTQPPPTELQPPVTPVVDRGSNISNSEHSLARTVTPNPWSIAKPWSPLQGSAERGETPGQTSK